MNDGIKETHEWDILETLYATCPHCDKENEITESCGGDEDVLKCLFCKKLFKLGEVF